MLAEEKAGKLRNTLSDVESKALLRTMADTSVENHTFFPNRPYERQGTSRRVEVKKLCNTLDDLHTRAIVNTLAERLPEVRTETFGDVFDDVINNALVHRPNETLAKVTNKTIGQTGRCKDQNTSRHAGRDAG